MKFRKLLFSIFVSSIGLTSILSFQNCAPAFEVLHNANVSADGVPDPDGDGAMSSVLMKSLGGFRYQRGFCGIESEGRLVCWGHKGSPKSEIIPLPVKVVDTVAYASGQCALSVEGKVFCWSTYPTWQTPIEVSLPKAIQIAASNIGACVLTEDHRVLCLNAARVEPPNEIGELNGALAITSNLLGVCGILAAKNVRCVTMNTPRVISEIAGISDAVEIRSGGGFPAQVCALEKGSGLKCFGRVRNEVTGTETWSAATLFSANVRTFDVGGDGGICGVRSDDKILCSGVNDRFQIANSSITEFAAPVEVATLAVRNIRKSQNGTTCVLLVSGAVKCWGADDISLGYDRVHNFESAFRFEGFDGVKEFSLFGNYTVQDVYLLKDNGDVYCRSSGRINLGGAWPSNETCGSAMSSAPVSFQNLKNVRHLQTVGGSSMCALLESGKVTCWGKVPADQRQPSNETPFGIMQGFSGATQIGYGGQTLCALAGQKISCAHWNSTDYGTDDYQAPTPLAGTALITQMTVGYGGVCGLTTAGRVVCWADANPASSTAVDLGLSGVAEIVSVNSGRTCARLNDGTVSCWSLGDDVVYENDVPNEVKKLQPKLVVGLDSIAKLYAAEANDSLDSDAICGTKANGTAICKGARQPLIAPPDVSVFSGVQSLLVHGEFTCARSLAGTSCVGRKPYRLTSDFLGQALIF